MKAAVGLKAEGAGSLDDLLLEVTARARGVRGSVISDRDGLPIASHFGEPIDVGVIAAMGTLLAQAADSVYDNLRLTKPEITVIEGKEANIAVLSLADGTATMLTIMDKGANIGFVKIEMRRAAARIAEALGHGTKEGRARIAELFVLHSGGTLIRHYSDTLRTDFDRDILGGMFTAIQSFVKAVLAAKGGALEEMRYGNQTICFVRGTHTIAAIVLAEGDPEVARYAVFDALKDFEEKYHAALESWDGTLHTLPGIDDCFSNVLHA